MKICVTSDLHVNHPQPPINWPEADVLVIAGDTSNTIGDDLKLARRVSKIYNHVVITDGNHTHYANEPQKRTVEDTLLSLRKQLPENVHLLGHGNPRVDIDGVHFVGCNGWYSFDMLGDPIENRLLWKSFMNDNRWIGFDKIEQMQPWDRASHDAELMRATLQEIADEEIGQIAKPIVAITHTAPHRDMVLWTDDPRWNRSNSFYVNSHMQTVLESDVGQRVTYWANGHTHHGSERTIGKVVCVCNPRGYPSENPGWKPLVLPILV